MLVSGRVVSSKFTSSTKSEPSTRVSQLGFLSAAVTTICITVSIIFLVVTEASNQQETKTSVAYEIFPIHSSGQITIIPKPELRGFWGDSLTKPPFGVTSAEVAIICPDSWVVFVFHPLYTSARLTFPTPQHHTSHPTQVTPGSPEVQQITRVRSKNSYFPSYWLFNRDPCNL